MTMDELRPGQSAWITSVGGDGALRHHLLDMGLTPKTEVVLQKVAPMGDPIQIALRGYELTLRLDEAKISKLRMSTSMVSSPILPRDGSPPSPTPASVRAGARRRSSGRVL